jgi:hypothetical protein
MSSGDRRIFRMQDHAPNGWKFQSLYDLAEYINGKAFRQSELGDKGLPVIKIAELHNGITASTKYYDGKIEEWFYLKKENCFLHGREAWGFLPGMVDQQY